MAVVVGYDGSDGSERALEWAVEEARLRGLPLEVVAVWDEPTVDVGMGAGAVADPNLARVLEERADDIAARGAAMVEEVPVTSRALPGPAATALIDLSRDAELIVTGSHSKRGVAEILLGSTSDQVATHSTCPTIVVRPKPIVNQRLAVAVDGSHPGSRALDWAFEEASRRGWKVRVIHAWDVHVVGFDVDDSTYPKGGILDEVKDAETRLKAMETLGVRADEAVAFEDAPNGVKAARAAGLFVVAVPNPITSMLAFEGESLRVNVALVLNNARLAAHIARAWAGEDEERGW